jgi:hypothetical protein
MAHNGQGRTGLRLQISYLGIFLIILLKASQDSTGFNVSIMSHKSNIITLMSMLQLYEMLYASEVFKNIMLLIRND